eukprot:gene6910-biopygen11797
MIPHPEPTLICGGGGAFRAGTRAAGAGRGIRGARDMCPKPHSVRPAALRHCGTAALRNWNCGSAQSGGELAGNGASQLHSGAGSVGGIERVAPGAPPRRRSVRAWGVEQQVHLFQARREARDVARARDPFRADAAQPPADQPRQQ